MKDEQKFLLEKEIQFLDLLMSTICVVVLNKFGVEKQKQKLIEEAAEYFKDNSVTEATDFLFVALQLFHSYGKKIKELEKQFPFDKQTDYEKTIPWHIERILLKMIVGKGSDDLLGESVMNLIYGLMTAGERMQSMDSFYIMHLTRISYHCSRLVKYEFKE